MSAAAHANHHITDHLCRWSRTGRDGACPDRLRRERSASLQRPSSINAVIAIGLGRRIVSPGGIVQGQPRRRSAFAETTATTKSP